MSIVTYPTPCPTTVLAWPSMSAAFAPDLASLLFLPLIAGFFARIRRYWLFTAA
jgi:hypothetical protein